MIWLTAKTPISTGRSLSPLLSMYQSKVSLGWPAEGSTPGMETSMPRSPAISPLTRLPWLTEAISTMAIKISVKYSNGPNRVAQIESGLASTRRKIQEMMPPANEAAMPSPSARPGRPERAIG